MFIWFAWWPDRFSEYVVEVGDHSSDEAVFNGLFGAHPVVPVGVFLYLLDLAAAFFSDDLVGTLAELENLLRGLRELQIAGAAPLRVSKVVRAYTRQAAP